jgi:hypothetical protein
MRKTTASAAVLVVLLACVSVFVVARVTKFHVPFLSDTCRAFAADDVARVSPEQLAHAATITAVSARRGLPTRAATIALATALQESKLRNLPTGDRDSIGLFQQRPSQGWGTEAQLTDPRYSAGKFYDRLLRVPHWQTMRLTEAAQAVQRSGHPELYQKWEDEARTLAAGLLGEEPGAVTCQLRQPPARGGAGAAQALIAEMALDLGKLSVAPSKDGDTPVLTVAVGGGGRSTVGWRSAHWFVAKAHEYGVRQVTYGGNVWTADSGKWSRRGKADAGHVEVRIAADG